MDKVVCFSLRANVVEKDMDLFILLAAVGK